MAVVKMKRKRTTEKREMPELVEEAQSLQSNGCEWVRGAMLGKGGFGSVYLASVKTSSLCCNGLPSNSIMAVKSALFSASLELVTESSILEKFTDCPFVIHRFGQDMTVDKDGNCIFNMLLEYAAGGTIGDLIKESGGSGLLELQVKKYTDAILKGLNCIHERGYVHCDLKPENILLVANTHASGTEFVPKIGDLGLSKRAGIQSSKPCCKGTAMYFSPEAVTYGIQEQPSDIWALGCVVLKMLTGRNPWDVKAGTKPRDLLPRIASESPIIPSELSEEAKDFLEKCFVRNPSKRFTAAMLLNHPFVTNLAGVREIGPSKEASSVSSSERCDLGYASFIPLGSWSSEEAEEMEEHLGANFDQHQILPLALLYPKDSRPLFRNRAVLRKSSAFTIMGAA